MGLICRALAILSGSGWRGCYRIVVRRISIIVAIWLLWGLVLVSIRAAIPARTGRVVIVVLAGIHAKGLSRKEGDVLMPVEQQVSSTEERMLTLWFKRNQRGKLRFPCFLF